MSTPGRQPFGFSAPPVSNPAPGVLDAIADRSLVKDALKQDFDYIIVGGGTAGLVLANRLSAVRSLRVLVLEAGTLERNLDGITIPGLAGSECGTDLDWQYSTVPQKNLGGKVISWPRGKLLGGSSCFNMMVWQRGMAEDYDAWEALGNDGWSWKSFLPYFKRSETFYADKSTVVGDVKQEVFPAFVSSAHGREGPIQASYNRYLSPHLVGIYDGINVDLNIPESLDVNSGDNSGVAWIPASIDPKTQTRSSSEAAYLEPILGRPNLLVITNAHATELIWDSRQNVIESDRNEGRMVEGVAFLSSDGGNARPFRARAILEVILCGGSINTPQLLELSGVGDPRLLREYGIESVVNLPGVGENLQDHLSTSLTFKLKDGYKSMDEYRRKGANPFADQVHALYEQHQEGLLTQTAPLMAFLPAKRVLTADELQEIRASTDEASADLRNACASRVPMVELCALNFNMGAVPEPNANYVGIMAAMLHPKSRGSIHISSSDPFLKPTIDPNYLSHPFDRFFLAKGAQTIREIADTPAFSRFIEKEAAPGLDKVSKGSDDAWRKYFKAGNVGTVHHPVGTASMMPRRKGGVVDQDLRVYGTLNLRIADASIMPLIVSSHTQATVYAIAEKLSDLLVPNGRN